MSGGQKIIDGLNAALAWAKGDADACHILHVRAGNQEGKVMTYEQLVEKVARAIYEHWNFYPDDAGKDCTPWVQGGNSFRQEQARDYARAALAVVYQALVAVNAATWTAGGAEIQKWRDTPFYASKYDSAVLCFQAMLAASPLNPEGKP